MNKFLHAAAAVVVLAIAASSSAWAQDDYADQWAPQVGTPMPVLEAPDQTGLARNLESLAGEQGLLLFINRSADW